MPTTWRASSALTPRRPRVLRTSCARRWWSNAKALCSRPSSPIRWATRCSSCAKQRRRRATRSSSATSASTVSRSRGSAWRCACFREVMTCPTTNSQRASRARRQTSHGPSARSRTYSCSTTTTSPVLSGKSPSFGRASQSACDRRCRLGWRGNSSYRVAVLGPLRGKSLLRGKGLLRGWSRRSRAPGGLHLALELLHVEVGEQRDERKALSVDARVAGTQQIGDFPRRVDRVGDEDPHAPALRQPDVPADQREVAERPVEEVGRLGGTPVHPRWPYVRAACRARPSIEQCRLHGACERSVAGGHASR